MIVVKPGNDIGTEVLLSQYPTDRSSESHGLQIGIHLQCDPCEQGQGLRIITGGGPPDGRQSLFLPYQGKDAVIFWQLGAPRLPV